MTNPLKKAWCPHCDDAVKAEILRRRMVRGEIVIRLFCPNCERTWDMPDNENAGKRRRK